MTLKLPASLWDDCRQGNGHDGHKTEDAFGLYFRKKVGTKLSLLLCFLCDNSPIMTRLAERHRGGQGVTGCGIRLCFFQSLGRGINILLSGRGVCLEKMNVDVG